MKFNKDQKKSEWIMQAAVIFEKSMSVVLATIIAVMVVYALIRIAANAYIMIFSKLGQPESIIFDNFNTIFSNILTLFISVEFMNSILKVLKSHEVRNLVADVALVTMLALCRKFIVMDYSHYHPVSIFALGFILLAVGITYFLIKRNTLPRIGEKFTGKSNLER